MDIARQLGGWRRRLAATGAIGAALAAGGVLALLGGDFPRSLMPIPARHRVWTA